MNRDLLKGRHLKKRVTDLLENNSFEAASAMLVDMPLRRVINPLFSLLYHGNPILRWRAVSAMGTVVAHLAAQDMASARVVMRRLMWNLNDESGGIGWGSPEAMGEILASSPPLAKEYAKILISYLHPQGNFLEHELLQQGTLWGFGRLAHARPDLLKGAAWLLIPFMQAPDASRRGLAAWATGPLGAPETKPALKLLSQDRSEITLYLNCNLVLKTVSALAMDALARMNPNHQPVLPPFSCCKR